MSILNFITFSQEGCIVYFTDFVDFNVHFNTVGFVCCLNTNLYKTSCY